MSKPAKSTPAKPKLGRDPRNPEQIEFARVFTDEQIKFAKPGWKASREELKKVRDELLKCRSEFKDGNLVPQKVSVQPSYNKARRDIQQGRKVSRAILEAVRLMSPDHKFTIQFKELLKRLVIDISDLDGPGPDVPVKRKSPKKKIAKADPKPAKPADANDESDVDSVADVPQDSHPSDDDADYNSDDDSVADVPQDSHPSDDDADYNSDDDSVADVPQDSHPSDQDTSHLIAGLREGRPNKREAGDVSTNAAAADNNHPAKRQKTNLDEYVTAIDKSVVRWLRTTKGAAAVEYPEVNNMNTATGCYLYEHAITEAQEVVNKRAASIMETIGSHVDKQMEAQARANDDQSQSYFKKRDTRMTLSEKKIVTLETEMVTLETENKAMKGQIEEMKKQIEELKKNDNSTREYNQKKLDIVSTAFSEILRVSKRGCKRKKVEYGSIYGIVDTVMPLLDSDPANSEKEDEIAGDETAGDNNAGDEIASDNNAFENIALDDNAADNNAGDDLVDAQQDLATGIISRIVDFQKPTQGMATQDVIAPKDVLMPKRRAPEEFQSTEQETWKSRMRTRQIENRNQGHNMELLSSSKNTSDKLVPMGAANDQINQLTDRVAELEEIITRYDSNPLIRYQL